MEGRRIWLPFMFIALLLSACTAPRFEGSTLEGKKAIIDAVDNDLTNLDCTSAITKIEGLYNSSNTDNEVRLARAAAQGCAGGAKDMVATMDLIIANPAVLAGPAFWELLAQMSWETSTTKLDTKITASNNSIDALFSAVSPGTIIAAADQINAGTPNVGTIVADDRVGDANLYLSFISMYLAGNLQDRYGAPTATFKRGQLMGQTASQPAGWTLNSNVTNDACAYASSLVNLMDAIDVVGKNLEKAEYAKAFKDIAGQLGPLLDEACDAACRGEDTGVVDYGAAGCAFAADHDCKGTAARPCMLALRDRRICTSTDPLAAKAKCAAAGIALFVSKHPAGWSP
jgi:hypothetical protein